MLNKYSIIPTDERAKMSAVVNFIEYELGKNIEIISNGESVYIPNSNNTKLVSENLGETYIPRLLSKRIIPLEIINEINKKFGYRLSLKNRTFDETSGGMC